MWGGEGCVGALREYQCCAYGVGVGGECVEGDSIESKMCVCVCDACDDATRLGYCEVCCG